MFKDIKEWRILGEFQETMGLVQVIRDAAATKRFVTRGNV